MRCIADICASCAKNGLALHAALSADRGNYRNGVKNASL